MLVDVQKISLLNVLALTIVDSTLQKCPSFVLFPLQLQKEKSLVANYVLRKESRPDKPEDADFKEWFGEKVNADTAQRAITRIATCISHDANGAAIKRTPTMTGIYMLKRLLPYGHEYPSLPEEIQKLIRTNFTQARFESFPCSTQSIYIYDARLAYLACVREVPCALTGVVEQETTSEFAGKYQKAIYRVEVTIPSTWSHIGLVPRRPKQYQQYWDFPRTPGESWECWLTAEEVLLLVEKQWPHVIRERILFSKGAGCDPLRAFGEKLSERIEQLDNGIKSHPDDEELKLIRHGLRAIALNAIGYLHTSGARKYKVFQPGERIPEDLQFEPDFSVSHTRTGIQCSWSVPHTGMLGQFNHPEWSSYVWAKNRIRVTDFVLDHFTLDQVIAIHNDAVYVPEKTDIPTTTKVGAYRLKQWAIAPKAEKIPHEAALKKFMTTYLVKELVYG
jgi:hypothetical protein